MNSANAFFKIRMFLYVFLRYIKRNSRYGIAFFIFFVQLIRSIFYFWKPAAFVFNVAKWKRPIVRGFLAEYNIIYVPLNKDLYRYRFRILWSFNPVFIIWGRAIPENVRSFIYDNPIKVYHIEDGFLRSVGLGANRHLPYSICLDKTGFYYDYTTPSELELLLADYDFDANKELMDLAKQSIDQIKSMNLSKYNDVRTAIAPLIYGPKVKQRILVIGQVEDDQSLLFGCEKIMTNVELIQMVAAENPDAQIIYKPHPDIMAGLRKEISQTEQVSHLVEILRTSISLVDALYEVDRVYTLTSLAGFEAMMHGVEVTTIGAPFYAGWGLTDDRQIIERRVRKLSFEQIFAAAYILYPRYINPLNKKKSSISKVISTIVEQLDAVEVIGPEKALSLLRPYNLATQHSVDTRFLYKSTSSNFAIVTDTPESLQIARGLAAHGKNVTIICTRDALANQEEMLLSSEESQLIQVTSIHKRYSVALSDIEANTVKISQAFGDALRLAMGEMASQHLRQNVIDEFCLGLEDYVYFEILRFYGVEQSLKDFDNILVILRDASSSEDIVKSFIYNGTSSKTLGKIYLTLLNKNTREYLSSLECGSTQALGTQHLVDMRQAFSSFWWSLQDEKYNDYASYGKHIVVCGNISGENYAYSPASLKLIEVIERVSQYPVIFFNSGLLPMSGQEEAKSISLNQSLSERCTVYNGNLGYFRQKYPAEILSSSSVFSEDLYLRLIDLVRHRLPDNFIDIFRPRLRKYCESMFAHMVFVAEVSRTMSKATLYASSMDRSYIARILSAVARQEKVPSIGIQPQIISASLRYKPPSVDHMGVIDTSQIAVYQRLGANPANVHAVGSVNVISRLKMMSDAVESYGRAPDQKTIFFAMQHSTAYEMIETAIALHKICAQRGYQLIVKPHPHQELPILNKVRGLFADSPLVKVLSRESDTYEAVARCSIVVGLFSSVLLESALYGKDVVVAAFRDIEESIDFSRLGVAIKVTSAEALESTLIDLISRGESASRLEAGRAAYLIKNPQFLAPYTTATLERFIAQHVSH